MPIVTERLLEQIAEQVRERHVVVWCDPDHQYAELSFAQLESALQRQWPAARVARYRPDRGFFSLRQELESVFGEWEPPRLVIYVPLGWQDTASALVEFQVSGCLMGPDQPDECNTGLVQITRSALAAIVPQTRLDEIVQQVRQGQLSLAELDRLPERVEETLLGALSVVFGSGRPQEVALSFLSGSGHDQQLEQKQATEALARLLRGRYGLSGEWNTPERLRHALALHVLGAEFQSDTDHELDGPPRLVDSSRLLAQCRALADIWRKRSDTAESYIEHANQVARELRAGAMELTISQMVSTRTFRVTEQALLESISEKLHSGESAGLVPEIEARLGGFWSQHVPQLGAAWRLLDCCARLLAAAQSIDAALPHGLSVGDLVSRYTDTGAPWCLLDTWQRRIEELSARLDYAHEFPNLANLVATTRERYMGAGSRLASAFVHAYGDNGCRTGVLTEQGRVFSACVQPWLGARKTAYVLVDALRYEMALEMLSSLDDGYDAKLSAGEAAIPTITEVGMAALVLGSGHKLALRTENSKLAVYVGDTKVSGRTARMDYVREHAHVPVAVATLDEVLRQRKGVQDEIQQAQLVIVTSREIDLFGESESLVARSVMGDMAHNLRRTFDHLTRWGVERIVFSADHGHLYFPDAVGDDMVLDAPGGRTVALHRRVWLGLGGIASGDCLRAPLPYSEDADALELASPFGFSIFRGQGGTTFLHGGFSLPELIIPIGVLVPRTPRDASMPVDVSWRLSPGSAQITSRVLTVEVSGRANTLLSPPSTRLRLELRAEGEAVSTTIGASSGFEDATHDVQVAFEAGQGAKVNVYLLVDSSLSANSVSLHLLDASNGVELARLENIPVAILD